MGLAMCLHSVTSWEALRGHYFHPATAKGHELSRVLESGRDSRSGCADFLYFEKISTMKNI